MGFELKILTDDEREQMGFARTMDDVKVGNGMKFVDICAEDQQHKAVIVSVFVGRNRADMELHWQDKTVLINASISETRWLEARDVSGIRKYDTLFEVVELSVPDALKNLVKDVDNLVVQGLSSYGHGSLKYYGSGKALISPDVTRKYYKHIKSKTKLSDFVISQ